MIEHIVVIVDSSPTSQYAVGASITVAHEIGADLFFLLTVDPELTAAGVGTMPMAQMAHALMAKTLNEAIARAHHAGVSRASGVVLDDDPVSGIVSTARARNADLIMLGVAPRVGILRPFIRSLAEAVLKETTIPLCAVRRPARGFLTHRIIVPIVDDVLAALAVAQAIDIAVQFKSTLVFCSLITREGEASARDAVERAMATAAQHGVAAEQLVLDPSGRVSSAIVRNADLHACDSIVMATHVRQGLPRIVDGSVTDAVIYRSDVPVIIVRPKII